MVSTGVIVICRVEQLPQMKCSIEEEIVCRVGGNVLQSSNPKQSLYQQGNLEERLNWKFVFHGEKVDAVKMKNLIRR